MEYIPALSLLTALLLIILAGILKFGTEDLLTIITNTNFVLITAIFLFCVVGIIQLFEPQQWTADLLKVLVGVLVGSATAPSAASRRIGGVDAAGNITVSDDGALAGRDINELVERVDQVKGDIGEVAKVAGDIREIANVSGDIREVASVSGNISQLNAQLVQVAHALDGYDPSEKQYLLLSIGPEGFLTHGEVPRHFSAIKQATLQWEAEGWTLESIMESGSDGTGLLFKRRATSAAINSDDRMILKAEDFSPDEGGSPPKT